METDLSKTSASAIFFILGAFFASLSWQSLLAIISGIAHRNLTARVQAVTYAIGNLVIIGLGISILLGLHI
jgi:arginine exporter protein ArgO